MSAPVKMRTFESGDYGRSPDGTKRPRVSDITGLLGIGADERCFWAARLAAEQAIDDWRRGGTEEATIRRAMVAHIRVRDEAAEAGTLAHAFIEAYLRSGAVPPEAVGFLEDDERTAKARVAFNKFRTWWDSTGCRLYEVVDIETALIEPVLGFGGTRDYLLRRFEDNALIIADTKTGKTVDAKVTVQMGGYEVLAASPAAVRRDDNMPNKPIAVAGGLVIHAPVTDAPVAVAHLSPEQMRAGREAFMALLVFIHKAQHRFKLSTDSTLGVP